MHRLSRLSCLALVPVLAFACGDDDQPPVDAAADTGQPPPEDASGPEPDAFVAPLVDPGLFDCTAPAAPERTSPRPLHCALDGVCTDRLVSAHRGAGAPGELAPEDTLPAFRAAIVVGADLTELDVRVTADEQLVVIHDATVDRTTDGTGEVATMTLAELQSLSIDAERYAGDFGCARIPTLAEVLALTNGRITTVIDGTKTDRIDLIVAAIQAADAVDEVVLDADPDVVEAALALEPELPFFVRAESVEELAILERFTAPAPRYVHIGSATDEALIAAVGAAGQRVFGLAFAADVTYALTESPAVYTDLWERGVQMLQTNRPELVAPLAE